MAVLEAQRIRLEEQHKKLGAEREQLMAPRDPATGNAIQQAQHLDKLDEQLALNQKALRTLSDLGQALEEALFTPRQDAPEEIADPAAILPPKGWQYGV
jgi:hypothetical protein